jgi:predicted small metal-binding protein
MYYLIIPKCKWCNADESVPTGFTDYCRDLILYAHSIDDIKDDDIDKIKKEDYINFLLPATNWNNNLFYLII